VRDLKLTESAQYLADASENLRELPAHLDEDDQARAIIASAQANAAAAIVAAVEELTQAVTRIGGVLTDLHESVAVLGRRT